MDGRRSKRMARHEHEIAMATTKLNECKALKVRLENFTPTTADGKKAHGEALQQLDNEINTNQSDIDIAQSNLEVATVEFITGRDTELAPEPGLIPRDREPALT